MLKSLELFGFKSFADRTRFDFHPGITGVVGPNGSGKSNVVDAVKWILGDQSAKSLRGKEMTDVIFNGAAGRKPAGFAEATLTFDNSGGLLPIESQEVQIGRRLWRSGDAEYLINRTPARLRDVRELFMGTGAGSAAYCIIEQGRVDQILQANASARRQVFEEAAGISLYKARRTEAQRRLDRVDQNLLRLTDIVDEIEAQLNATRSQAARAARFRDLSNELREAWLGLAADDWRHQTARLEQTERQLAACTADAEALAERQQRLESRLAALDAAIADVDDRLREVDRHSSANREEIARHEATVRHETARCRELETDLVRLRRQRQILAARVREVLDEQAHHQGVLEQVQDEHRRRLAELEAYETETRQLTEQLETSRAAVEQDRRHLLERTREASAAEQRIAGLHTQRQAAAEGRTAAETRLDELDGRIAECRAECDRRRLKVEAAATHLAEADGTVRDLRQRRETLLREQDQYQRTLADQREQRSGWQARLSVLEDLEQRQEGLGIGVKEILSRARTSDYPPWNRILGSVADLLEVDLEQAALLEVALGGRAQLIIIEDLDPLLEYLNRAPCPIAGRVSFLAHLMVLSPEGGVSPEGLSGKGDWLPSGIVQTSGDHKFEGACPLFRTDSQAEPPSTDTSPPAPAANPRTGRFDHFRLNPMRLPDLADQAGVVSRADRMVRGCPRVPRLPEQLLADTWIVETLDTALELSAGAGRRCRFVTLQGELLEADGTLTVGTVRSETALVSRRSELRRLKNDLLRLDRQIADEERRLTGLSESLAAVVRELHAAEADLQERADRCAALRSDLTAQEAELERRRAERDALKTEIADVADREQALDQSLADAQQALAATQEELQSLQRQIDSAANGLAGLEHRMHELAQQAAAGRLELTRQEERLAGLQTSFERLEQDRGLRLAQAEEAERRFESAGVKLRESELAILQSSAVLAELFLKSELCAARAAAVAAEKHDLRQQRRQMGEEESVLRRLRREQTEARHRHEIEARDLRTALSTLAARIEEEYQVALTDVVASGASALKGQETRVEGQGPEEGQGSRVKGQGPDEDSESDANRHESAAENAPSQANGDADHSDPSSHGAHEDASALALDPCPSSLDPPPSLDPSFETLRPQLEAHVDRLRRKLKHLGNVNTDSLDELDELESRYARMHAQLQDLVEAKRALEEIVRRINQESRRLFAETFEAVRGNFRHLFRKAFGGGDGDIVLEDPEDVLDCGIDIVARPPGKELKSITLMSGGEKTLTAFALLLAIFQCRPSPYCLLDEVDAALDEANVERLTALLQEFEHSTQFIVITHKKPTMTICDALYGVTMEEAGVSKRMSVRFDDVSENGEFQASEVRRAA